MSIFKQPDKQIQYRYLVYKQMSKLMDDTKLWLMIYKLNDFVLIFNLEKTYNVLLSDQNTIVNELRFSSYININHSFLPLLKKLFGVYSLQENVFNTYRNHFYQDTEYTTDIIFIPSEVSTKFIYILEEINYLK